MSLTILALNAQVSVSKSFHHSIMPSLFHNTFVDPSILPKISELKSSGSRQEKDVPSLPSNSKSKEIKRIYTEMKHHETRHTAAYGQLSRQIEDMQQRMEGQSKTQCSHAQALHQCEAQYNSIRSMNESVQLLEKEMVLLEDRIKRLEEGLENKDAQYRGWSAACCFLISYLLYFASWTQSS